MQSRTLPDTLPSDTQAYPTLPRLTAAQEQDLATRRMAGDSTARETLILHNISLAFKMAQTFRGGRYAHYLADLSSVAVIGLIQAADRYEPGKVSRGKVVRFGTYATRLIRNVLANAHREDLATIQIPISAARAVIKMEKTANGSPDVSAKPSQPYHRKMVELAVKARQFDATGRFGEDFDSLAEVAGPPETDDDDRDQRIPVLMEALDRLRRESPECHTVLSLIYLDGRDVASIYRAAIETGRTNKWVKETRDQGFRLIKRYLKEAGVSEELAGGLTGRVAAVEKTGRGYRKRRVG